MGVLAAAVFTAVLVELVHLVKVTTAALEIAMAVITPAVEAVARVQWAGMQAEAQQAMVALEQRQASLAQALHTLAVVAAQVVILGHQQAVLAVAVLVMALEVAQQELQTLAVAVVVAVQVAQAE
jgi:hypothetical protein